MANHRSSERGGAMYALAVNVTIESGKEDEAQKELQENVVPMVKQAPGLVAGYWMNPQNGYGYALILFDSEENANAAKQMAESGPRPDFVKMNPPQLMEAIATA